MAKKILVIEDSYETRNQTKSKLEEAGFAILTAVDGVDALKVLKDNSEIDLIFTDYRMPTLGGQDLIELLNHHYPKIKKIVFSGYPFIKDQLPKEIPLIPKPIDWEAALQLIKQSLSQ